MWLVRGHFGDGKPRNSRISPPFSFAVCNALLLCLAVRWIWGQRLALRLRGNVVLSTRLCPPQASILLFKMEAAGSQVFQRNVSRHWRLPPECTSHGSWVRCVLPASLLHWGVTAQLAVSASLQHARIRSTHGVGAAPLGVGLHRVPCIRPGLLQKRLSASFVCSLMGCHFTFAPARRGYFFLVLTQSFALGRFC